MVVGSGRVGLGKVLPIVNLKLITHRYKLRKATIC